MSKVGPWLRLRLSIASRVLAGTLGAYAFASLATVLLSQVLIGLGFDAVEAVTGATLASFAVFAVAAIATFHARSARRAWGWLLAAAVPLALGMVFLLPGVSR